MSRKPARIQLFHTCILNEIHPEAAMAAARVLERLGVAVEVPLGQTCCGQPAYNGGFHSDARKVARHTLDVLAATEGPIVIPSGSCGDMLTHQYPLLFADDPAYLAKARDVAGRCREFSVFIAEDLGSPELGARLAGPRKAAYHPSCHLLRGLEARTQPLSLLGKVGGLECVPVQDQEECCGFGGMFSVKNPGVSGAMLENKLRHIAASGADTVISCDMGCLLHLEGGLRRKGSAIAVRHIAEILDEGMSA